VQRRGPPRRGRVGWRRLTGAVRSPITSVRERGSARTARGSGRSCPAPARAAATGPATRRRCCRSSAPAQSARGARSPAATRTHPLLRARSSLAARTPRCAPSPRGRSPLASPGGERLQPIRHRREPPQRLLDRPVRPRDPQAGHHFPLVDLPPHQGVDTTSIARAPPPGGLSSGCGARSVQGLSCVLCRAARNLRGVVWAPGSPSLAGLARPCSSIAHPPLRRPQRTRSHHLFSSPGGPRSGIEHSLGNSYVRQDIV
jgi:hypothetical protein